VSYAIACYALVVLGVATYAAALARTRRRLAETLEAQRRPNRG
jgi:hypothetical protein